MSENGIRGQEVVIKVSVDGQTGDGSWTRVTDWTVTPRTEFKESDYLGESTSDIDVQHNGFDLAFNADMEDANIAAFVDTIVDREAMHLPHPNITITQIVQPRKSGIKGWAWLYTKVKMKVDSEQSKGRKEQVSMALSGKCRTRKRITI